eukprot:scaffold55524_cov38-Cyclotella_meneghiniana.AAC.3
MSDLYSLVGQVLKDQAALDFKKENDELRKEVAELKRKNCELERKVVSHVLQSQAVGLQLRRYMEAREERTRSLEAVLSRRL